MRGGFDRERAARVLVDAVLLGDKKASQRWQVTERTIGNYRARLKSDEALSELYERIGREAERNWHLVRNRFLRDVTEHLRELCLKAGPDQIKDVREAIKDIGELDITQRALNVDDQPPKPRPAAQTDARGAESDPESAPAEAEEGDERAGT